MQYTNIEIKVPSQMRMFIHTEDGNLNLKQNAMLLYPYIHDMTISHGKAAEILGINKLDLIDFYAEMGLPYFNLDVSEIKEEMDAYQEVKRSKV